MNRNLSLSLKASNRTEERRIEEEERDSDWIAGSLRWKSGAILLFLRVFDLVLVFLKAGSAVLLPFFCSVLQVFGRDMKGEEQTMSLFGISLTGRPKWQQFLLCSSGFFFGYLVNGVCEEYVYNRLQFSYGWYFTFVQGFVYLALIHLQGFTTTQMANPWKTYVKLSTVLMGSHGLTKGSLAFLNYPAQLMFKSTKVLPVMVMGAFIPGLRRKYPAHEYISAVILVAGLVLFTLADAQTSPNFSVIGVVMVSSALVMDSFVGNLQEAIFTMNPETTQMEMLFCSTVVGLPLLIPPMLLTGELFQAWNSCNKHLYVYAVLVFEAMATFIGQVSVLSLVAIFGAATTALVTTARKAVTLLLSYIIFTKPLTEQHSTGLLLISMGIILKLIPEYKEPVSWKQKQQQQQLAAAVPDGRC